MSLDPQTEVECALIRGEKLTTETIRRMCEPHTMDGRKIITRLNRKFLSSGKEIARDFLNGNKYKTYWLQKIKQQQELSL